MTVLFMFVAHTCTPSQSVQNLFREEDGQQETHDLFLDLGVSTGGRGLTARDTRPVV